MNLERVGLDSLDWRRLDSFEDRFVYQTREWLEFLERSQGAEPVVAELRDDDSTIGYFTGAVLRRYGVRILGSPMPGWTTLFMGFNLEPGISRRAAVQALPEFAFGALGCAHVELWDRAMTLDDVAGLDFDHSPWRGIEVDLSPSEDEIFAGFKSECRTAVRKAAKAGVTVEEAEPGGFVDDFYPQLEDVFAKQGLVPPFKRERIEELLATVHPGGRLLLLKVRDADGECIASGIFPGTNRSMHFLSGASWRSSQHLRPNEALLWEAMRVWKARGAAVADLGGFMSYKLKYRGREVHVPALRKSRSATVGTLRNLARTAFAARQQLRGTLRRTRG